MDIWENRKEKESKVVVCHYTEYNFEENTDY